MLQTRPTYGHNRPTHTHIGMALVLAQLYDAPSFAAPAGEPASTSAMGEILEPNFCNPLRGRIALFSF